MAETAQEDIHHLTPPPSVTRDQYLPVRNDHQPSPESGSPTRRDLKPTERESEAGESETSHFNTAVKNLQPERRLHVQRRLTFPILNTYKDSSTFQAVSPIIRQQENEQASPTEPQPMSLTPQPVSLTQSYPPRKHTNSYPGTELPVSAHPYPSLPWWGMAAGNSGSRSMSYDCGNPENAPNRDLGSLSFNEFFEQFKVSMERSKRTYENFQTGREVRSPLEDETAENSREKLEKNEDVTKHDEETNQSASPLNLTREIPVENGDRQAYSPDEKTEHKENSDTETDSEMKKYHGNERTSPENSPRFLPTSASLPNGSASSSMTQLLTSNSTSAASSSLALLQSLRSSSAAGIFFGLQPPPSHLQPHVFSHPQLYPFLPESYHPMTTSAARQMPSHPGVLSLLGQTVADPNPSALPIMSTPVPGLPRAPTAQTRMCGSQSLGFYPPGFVVGGVNPGRRPSIDKPPAVKKYKCDVCDKAFSRSNTLVTHKRIHTGDKPFKCEQCGRAFRQPGNLTRHRLTHTTHKPYVCSQCGKAFNRASNLNTHMRTHANIRPFSCPVCQRHFTHKNELRLHVFSHSEQSSTLSTMLGQ